MNKQNKTVLGIDPGLDGGLAIIGPGIRIAATMPVRKCGGSKRELNVADVIFFLKDQQAEWRGEYRTIDLTVIEKVHSMPQQSSQSTFTFGYGYGQICGVLECLGIPFIQVTPQAWKKLILAGTVKDKHAAIAYVAKRYPHINLLRSERSTKSHDGMADAVCLAEYGLRTQFGESQ